MQGAGGTVDGIGSHGGEETGGAGEGDVVESLQLLEEGMRLVDQWQILDMVEE